MLDFASITKALPQIMAMAPKAEEFMGAWVKFMNHLGEKLKWSESKLETIDNKLTYVVREIDQANERLILIMAETNLTPTIHDGVIGMAASDPRNQPGYAEAEGLQIRATHSFD